MHQSHYDEVFSVNVNLHTYFSPDSKHVGYIARNGEKWIAVLDNRISHGYDEVGRDFFLSPDAIHLAYLARNGDKWQVILDDKPCGEFKQRPNLWDELRSHCEPGPNPQLAAESERKQRLREAATRAREQFDEVEINSPVLSADGKSLAYAARKGEKWFVVEGNKQSGGYDKARDLAFSHDGMHLAYAAQKGGKWFAVIDGWEGEQFDEVRVLTTNFGISAFSPDGNRVAYAARRGGKWFMVADGQSGPAFDSVLGPFFSSDSSHLFYLAETGGKQLAVVDGHTAGEFDQIDDRYELILGPGGKHVAYRARIGEKQMVVADGLVGPEFYVVDPPIFSPDGDRIAYQASRSPKRKETYSDIAIENENLYAKYAVIPFPTLGNSTEDRPGGRGYFNLKKAGRQLAVVDGKAGMEFEGVAGLTFSPDSRHVAYAALRGQKQFVILDGQPSPAYDNVGDHSPVFDPDGSLEFLAIRANFLYRVKLTPKR